MERNTVLGWLRKRRAPHGQEPEVEGPPAPPLFPWVPPEPRIAPVLPIVWVPATPPPQAALAELGLDPVELCPPQDCRLPARTAHAAAIHLVRLPPGTVVFGGGHFLAAHGASFLAEQFPAGASDDHLAIDALAPFELPVTEIEQEVLLIGRHDLARWDVWLTDLLPKLLLAEHAFPGRFAYLLPAEVLNPPTDGGSYARMAASLDEAGIEPGRIFAADPATNTRFAALHAITNLWSDGVLHPHAADTLRHTYATLPAALRRRVAIEPAPGAAAPDSLDRLLDQLTARGFTRIRTATLSFVRETATFKGAATLFALPGETLASLIFSPPGTRLLTTAPDPLTSLIEARNGHVTVVAGDLTAALDALPE